MQWNCSSPFLQNIGYDPFSISKAPSYPQIIGEGDVTSVILPDGTIQLFFVPTNRHLALSQFQFHTNYPDHSTLKKDIWFVRSICHPLPPNLLNRQFSNVYGNQQPPSQFSPNCCINSPQSPDYYQKFHNDDSTSTTDIHYFYPSLRYNGTLKYSAEIQTEPFAINTTALGGCQCQGHRGCKNSDAVVKKNTNGDASASSTSYMSIDSTSKSKHRLTKKNKKKSKTNKSRYSLCECQLEAKKSIYKTNKSRDPFCECHLEIKKSKYKTNKSKDPLCNCHLESKSKYKTNKSKDPPCDCHLETKQTSDKLVTTFSEKASGGIVKGGRHTQTANKKTKRSDIQTEIWQPINCNSGSTLQLLSCDNCSDRCRCRSTSETDD